jgi:hypothetical protein
MPRSCGTGFLKFSFEDLTMRLAMRTMQGPDHERERTRDGC